MKRCLLALGIAAAAAVTPAQAQIGFAMTLARPSVYIQIGDQGAGVNTVTFNVPIGGSGTSGVVAGVSNETTTGSAPALTVWVGYRRAAGNPTRVNLLVTPTPTTGLADATFTLPSIPWTNFSWTSSNAGFIPNGSFTGAAQQNIGGFNYGGAATRSRTARLTFSYANTTAYAGGTYGGTAATGMVTFIATNP